MSIHSKTQELLRKTLPLIDQQEYAKIYHTIVSDSHYNAFGGEYTQCLLAAGLDPLKNSSQIYPYYLCRSDIKEFVVPDHINIIEESAFDACQSLHSISLPENLSNIGEFAFSDCFSLNQINIPDNVHVIGRGAFMGSAITSLVLPSKLKVISAHLCDDCAFLESIVIPRAIEKIDVKIFWDSSKLNKLIYNGTKMEWDTIPKAGNWKREDHKINLICKDGRFEI